MNVRLLVTVRSVVIAAAILAQGVGSIVSGQNCNNCWDADEYTCLPYGPYVVNCPGGGVAPATATAIGSYLVAKPASENLGSHAVPLQLGHVGTC